MKNKIKSKIGTKTMMDDYYIPDFALWGPHNHNPGTPVLNKK